MFWRYVLFFDETNVFRIPDPPLFDYANTSSTSSVIFDLVWTTRCPNKFRIGMWQKMQSYKLQLLETMTQNPTQWNKNSWINIYILAKISLQFDEFFTFQREHRSILFHSPFLKFVNFCLTFQCCCQICPIVSILILWDFCPNFWLFCLIWSLSSHFQNHKKNGKTPDSPKFVYIFTKSRSPFNLTRFFD